MSILSNYVPECLVKADLYLGLEGDIDGLIHLSDISDDDDFYVTIGNANCTGNIGNHDDPEITMSMDSETLTEIVSGELDGMAAFMGGRLQAEGDVMLGTRLSQLFKMN